MKKILLLAALSAFPMVSMAAAANACSGGNGTAITTATDGTTFVRVQFTPVCSANTIVRYDQNSTALWGGAGSAKGKNAFLGSTNGGSVKPGDDGCGEDGCNTTEVDAALSDAAPAGT